VSGQENKTMRGPEPVGMDYFAGLAMQAIITASGDAEGRFDYREKTVAALAYDMAAAMMAERARRGLGGAK